VTKRSRGDPSVENWHPLWTTREALAKRGRLERGRNEPIRRKNAPSVPLHYRYAAHAPCMRVFCPGVNCDMHESYV
jgi:hypothetical protein